MVLASYLKSRYSGCKILKTTRYNIMVPFGEVIANHSIGDEGNTISLVDYHFEQLISMVFIVDK